MNQFAPVSMTNEVLLVSEMKQKGSRRREGSGCRLSVSSSMDFTSTLKDDIF